MPDIYEQHAKAFEHVSAAIILRDGKKIGTIAFKHPRDGAGRLYCYLHVLGCEMVRGFASGGGYDKHSAAAWSAAQRCGLDKRGELGDASHILARQIRDAVKDTGRRWNDDLRAAGFEVLEAV